MKKTIAFFILLALLSTGCVPTEADLSRQAAAQDKLVVYTTIYPLYDFTKKIGGDRVEVIQIMPVGVDPHHFEPSAKMLARLSQAPLIIYNGAGMEPWLEKAKATLEKNKVLLVDTSVNIDLLTLEDEDSDHEHHRHGVDPHIWLSPRNAILQGQAIRDALMKVDPDNSPYYEENYARFVKELQKLDREYQTTLSPLRRKEIIVAHEALGYLARDYGLVQIPLRGFSAEAEPTPARLREIVRLAKAQNITHVFFETMMDPKVSQIIAEEIGAQILEINTLGNITQEQLDAGEDYFSLMRQNLANLKTALAD